MYNEPPYLFSAGVSAQVQTESGKPVAEAGLDGRRLACVKSEKSEELLSTHKAVRSSLIRATNSSKTTVGVLKCVKDD